MKKFNADGQRIKALRDGRERRATQKEFAHEVGVSVRQLRLIENQNKEISVAVLDRIAKALGVPRNEVVFAYERPRLVQPSGHDQGPTNRETSGDARAVTVSRFDTDYARAMRGEAELFEYAKDSHVVVTHMLTGLNAETESYAEELLDLLQPLTWEQRDILVPLDGRTQLQVRRRLRELLVLLKGNDVLVYATKHYKYLPESELVQTKRDAANIQIQTIVAFGPPGEYGEETVEVTVDHGHPWVYDPNARIF